MTANLRIICKLQNQWREKPHAGQVAAETKREENGNKTEKRKKYERKSPYLRKKLYLCARILST